MGIFSVFRKDTPQEVYQKIAADIVLVSLEFRRNFSGDSDSKQSINAGAEFSYLLVHLADSVASQVLGPAGRKEAFREILKFVIIGYVKADDSIESSYSVVKEEVSRMWDVMEERHDIYCQCKSLAGTPEFPFPSAGTKVFALAYFIHLAREGTSMDGVNNILCGRRNVTEENLAMFPRSDQIIILSTKLSGILKLLKLNDKLTKLR